MNYIQAFEKAFESKIPLDVYDENGRMIGLYRLCIWWIGTYTDDIFLEENHTEVVKIRELMKDILKKNKEFKELVGNQGR